MLATAQPEMVIRGRSSVRLGQDARVSPTQAGNLDGNRNREIAGMSTSSKIWRLFRLHVIRPSLRDICPCQNRSGDAIILNLLISLLSLLASALLRFGQLSQSIMYRTSSMAGNPDISLLNLLAIYLLFCNADALDFSYFSRLFSLPAWAQFLRLGICLEF